MGKEFDEEEYRLFQKIFFEIDNIKRELERYKLQKYGSLIEATQKRFLQRASEILGVDEQKADEINTLFVANLLKRLEIYAQTNGLANLGQIRSSLQKENKEEEKLLRADLEKALQNGISIPDEIEQIRQKSNELAKLLKMAEDLTIANEEASTVVKAMLSQSDFLASDFLVAIEKVENGVDEEKRDEAERVAAPKYTLR